MKKNFPNLFFLFLFLSLLTEGCAVKNPRLEAKRGILEGILVEDNTLKTKLVSEEYVIEPPDQISISVLGSPELSRQVTVRPDGIISMDLIGSIPIAGLKVSQAEKCIEERLVEFLKEADVTIEVTSFASKNIYVMGRVSKQGPQPYTGNNNVLNALSQAGLFTAGASIQNVLVVRGDKVNPKIIPVNFKDLATQGLSGEDILLKPNDIVLVTPNIYGRTAEVISTVLLPLGPITTPIFTLQSIDDTFGLDLAGTESGTSSAASDLAGATAASASSTTATTTTTGTP